MEDSTFQGWTTPLGPYPEGRKLPSAPARGYVGEVRSLSRATEESIRYAARTWPQGRAEDFERDGGSKLNIRRANTPAGMREHYRCSGRRFGTVECSQPDVPRRPIDSAVLEYFAQVALDLEATVAQMAGERDRRLDEVDAKLAQARSVQAEADRRLERLDGMLRDEGMTLDEWRRVAATPQSEAEAAAGAIADLTAERDAVEATEDIIDATDEAMERIAALRAAVAGDVTQAEGLASCVAAPRRVFDGFVLHRVDAPEAPHRVNAELIVGASYVLEPVVSEAARLGTMPAGTPVVSRSPLSLRQGTTRQSRQGRNNRSGSPTVASAVDLMFAPIPVTLAA